MYGYNDAYGRMQGGDPATMAYQQRLMELQRAGYNQQQPYQQGGGMGYQQYGQQPAIIKGRVVTGIDEARAAQIDLDGSMSYFPSPAENKIYVKFVGLDGAPVFSVYKRETSEAGQAGVSLEALAKRVEALEAQVKGAISNVSAANDAANGHVAEQ